MTFGPGRPPPAHTHSLLQQIRNVDRFHRWPQTGLHLVSVLHTDSSQGQKRLPNELRQRISIGTRISAPPCSSAAASHGGDAAGAEEAAQTGTDFFFSPQNWPTLTVWGGGGKEAAAD